MTITASTTAPPSNSINTSSSSTGGGSPGVTADKLKRDKLKRTRDEAGLSASDKTSGGGTGSSGSTVKQPVLDLSIKPPSSDGGSVVANATTAGGGSGSTNKKLLPNGSASGGISQRPDFMLDGKGKPDKNGKSTTTTECSVTLDKSKIDASVRLSSQVKHPLSNFYPVKSNSDIFFSHIYISQSTWTLFSLQH